MSVGPVPASPVSPVPGLCWAWRYNRCQEKRTYQKKGYFSHDTILLLPRLLPQQRHLCLGYNAAHAMKVSMCCTACHKSGLTFSTAAQPPALA